MVSKHIGRSQTDLMRIFEDVKEELSNLNTEVEDAKSSTNKTPNIESIVSSIKMKLSVQSLARQMHQQIL